MTIQHRVIGWRYLAPRHDFAHDSQAAIDSIVRSGRDDFLRGNPDKDENDLRKAGFTNAEISAYQRGFNSEARMHGYE